jgi:hypothetical protein
MRTLKFKPDAKQPDLYFARDETKEEVIEGLEWLIELMRENDRYPGFNWTSGVDGDTSLMVTQMERESDAVYVSVEVGVIVEND